MLQAFFAPPKPFKIGRSRVPISWSILHLLRRRRYARCPSRNSATRIIVNFGFGGQGRITTNREPGFRDPRNQHGQGFHVVRSDQRKPFGHAVRNSFCCSRWRLRHNRVFRYGGFPIRSRFCRLARRPQASRIQNGLGCIPGQLCSARRECRFRRLNHSLAGQLENHP
jgi:hypothetical protein